MSGLTITIEGEKQSGRTTMALVLRDILRDNNFNATIQSYSEDMTKEISEMPVPDNLDQLKGKDIIIKDPK